VVGKRKKNGKERKNRGGTRCIQGKKWKGKDGGENLVPRGKQGKQLTRSGKKKGQSQSREKAGLSGK